MTEFFSRLLSSDFLPHGHCFFWQPTILWLNVISDALIALSYYSIPIALLYFVKKRQDLAFHWIFVLFAIFIVACGTSHVMEIWNVWSGQYRLTGLVKFITAVASTLTAVLLWPLIPKALRLPSPRELERVNTALSREVEERKKAELDIQRLNQELAERVATTDYILNIIVQETTDAVFVKDKEGRYILANPTTAAVLGASQQEVTGKTDFELLPLEIAQRIHEVDRKVLNEQKSVIAEEVIPSNEGQKIYLSTKDPFKNSSGEVIGIIGLARDITDRKSAEKEREALLMSERAARNAAEHANRMKDEFLSTLSHELRTPLNAIVGWTHLIKRSPGDIIRVQQGIDTIERNARIQAQLVEDLLDLSRIVSGKIKLDVTDVEISGVIRLALETVRHAAEAKNITIQTDLSTDVIIRGDQGRLQQIIWNLLSNAIKFTPSGGKIVLTVDDLLSHVNIVVKDNGQGIAKDFLPHVFERFKQQDSSSSRRYGGLGIGLAVVKHLVDLHGGHITAESEGEGKGATFTVTLPLAYIARNDDENILKFHSDIHPLEGNLTPPLQGYKVLVVDDELDSRLVIQGILQDAGALVTPAASAEEALSLIENVYFHLLVSDIGMPNVDGYSLIRQIRQLPEESKRLIPAIALTAFARQEDRKNALTAGYQMHVSKPVDPDELTAAIKSLASLSHQAEKEDQSQPQLSSNL